MEARSCKMNACSALLLFGLVACLLAFLSSFRVVIAVPKVVVYCNTAGYYPLAHSRYAHMSFLCFFFFSLFVSSLSYVGTVLSLCICPALRMSFLCGYCCCCFFVAVQKSARRQHAHM